MISAIRPAMVFMLIVSSTVRAQEQPTYEEMMTQSLRVCLLGMGVEITANGDAGIRFLRKGVGGDFTIKREEYSSFMERLSEELRGEFTRDSRRCVEGNLDTINRYFLERGRLGYSQKRGDTPLDSYLPRIEFTALVNGNAPAESLMSGLESAFLSGLKPEHADSLVSVDLLIPKAGNSRKRMTRTDEMGLCPGRAFGTISRHIVELSAIVKAKTGNNFTTSTTITLVDCSDEDQNSISRQVLFAAAENAGCGLSSQIQGNRVSRDKRHIEVGARSLKFIGDPDPISIPLPACR